MGNTKPIHVKTITEFHRLWDLPQPEHPLIGVADCSQIKNLTGEYATNAVFDFYSICIKRGLNGKIKYGQQQYDFDNGVMFFVAPGQVFGVELDPDRLSQLSGWILNIHPDFLWNTPLANNIKQYEFFSYSANEALFLSEKEESILDTIIHNIQYEYGSNIDKFSQGIIISQIETLLNYAERFYQRQFITRKISNHKILERLEKLLTDYLNRDDLSEKGQPTVQYIAGNLNVSTSYLSGLLKMLTGKSTQQHIQDKIIEKAKEKLSTTDLSASEIAYELGFEYTQSFSKLFKAKTNLTPLQFRQTFR